MIVVIVHNLKPMLHYQCHVQGGAKKFRWWGQICRAMHHFFQNRLESVFIFQGFDMCNIKINKNTYNQLSGLDPTWQFARSSSALCVMLLEGAWVYYRKGREEWA